MTLQSETKKTYTLWIKTAILLLMFALAVTSAGEKSATFDEQGFLTRGVAYLRGENTIMRVGHPLGLNALNGSILATDDTIKLPLDDPSWLETSFHRPSELFMWEIGNNVERILFLGRLPTIWLGLLLAALAGRWAKEVSGRALAGVLALLLLALDPNILAHTRLATTDLGFAAGVLLAGYLLWRFWKRPTWGRALLAGAGFGLLQNTKFTAGLFVPIFGLVMLAAFLDYWRADRQSSKEAGSEKAVWRPVLMLLVCYPLAGFLVLWASNGFQIGTLPDNLPTYPQLEGLTLPLAHHVEQLLDIGSRLQKTTPSFLLGQYSDSGWWYYFPVAFVLKSSIPVLLMLLWAVVRYGLSIFRPALKIPGLGFLDAVALLIPPLAYFGFAITTDINLGYRHLLPVLPFLYVFIGTMLSSVRLRIPDRDRVINRPGFLLAALVGLVVVISLWIHPHYLAFFNAFAGGPNGGWRYLVDSNLDWGQDLGQLKGWMDKNDVDDVWLSYFGEGRPEYYRIQYRGLASVPPRLMNPDAQPIYPSDPAPGVYAISATTLQGVHFADPEQFAWFREREPLEKISYTIFLYEVLAYGQPADIALGNLQLGQIDAVDYGLIATNAVTPHWFDAGQSHLIPRNDSGWLALNQNTEVHPKVAEMIASWGVIVERDSYRLYRIPPEEKDNSPELATFNSGEGTILLRQVNIHTPAIQAGEELTLETGWFKAAPPSPLKIFIHVVDETGAIVAQWDGLGAKWEGWREKDTLIQQHAIQLPDTIVTGAYQLWAGLYNPETEERWPIETHTDGNRVSDDRLWLGEFVVQ